MELTQEEKAVVTDAFMSATHAIFQDRVFAAVSAVLEMRGHEALRKELLAKGDDAYCEFIAAMRRPDCLGAEHKIKIASFGTTELYAIIEAYKLYGKHLAYRDALQAALTPAAPEPPTDHLTAANENEPLLYTPGMSSVPHPPAAFQLVDQMLDAWYGDTEGMPPYDELQRGSMTAVMQVCLSSRDKEWSGWGVVEVAVRNPSVAEYMKHWEDRVKAAEDKLKSLTENADFLRKSVGACHLMISRNDLEELRQDEWDATHLPPRLYKFISELKGNLVALPDVEKAIRAEWYEVTKENGATLFSFVNRVRARLKPEPAKQERVTVHYSAKMVAHLVYDGSLHVGPLFTDKLDAERYANGLCAEIAEKGKAE